MSLPSLSALRAFEAAARHLSMSLAGDELHVTHAAISHQVRHLEDWCGAPLFHRDGRRLRLTASGQVLAGKLSPLFEAIGDTCERVRAMSANTVLKVGCIPSIATRWLIPNLQKFSQRHAEVDIRVVYAKANDRLNDSDLDVLITYGDDESRNVLTQHLFSRINTPVCNPHFFKQHGPFDTPEQIAASPLLHDETTQGWKEWCKAAGIADRSVQSGTVYQDFNLLATAVIAGHGIGLCPVKVFSEEIRRGDLVAVSDISTNGDKDYVAMIRRDRPQPAADFVSWFVDVVHTAGTL